jgi:Putative MetA-pathway of phenol degradation
VIRFIVVLLVLAGGSWSEVSSAAVLDGQTESERIDPDRPHLPEASTTVGKGRMILEGGYTFNEGKDSLSSAQDAPEAIFRAGILAEWFEVRIGQNFLKQGRSISGIRSTLTGIQDLYLGAKIALNRQKRYLPEIALIPQMTVPTGNHEVTGGRVLPGLNIDGNWEVIKNRYSIEFVVANNRIADDAR